MAYQENKNLMWSSDIFNVHNLNKPETYKPPKNQRITNNSSYDILSWSFNEYAPDKPKGKAKVSNLNKSSIFSNEPLPFQKIRNCPGNKTTFVLGNDDTSEYNRKREKSPQYDPNKYYRETTAYERKMKQLYGNSIKDKSIAEQEDKHHSAEKIRLDNLNNDSASKKCETARERKFQAFYGNNKAGNQGFVKRDPILSNNSTGIAYDLSKKGVYNTVEMMKSNIFYDPDKENINKNVFAKPLSNFKAVETENKAVRRKKRNICDNGDQACFAKLDWKDEKTGLLFKQQKDKVSDENKAYERKINDLYGKDAVPNPNVKKEKLNSDEKARRELEFKIHEEYPRENEAQIKKRIQNMSSIQQGDDFLNNNSKFKSNKPKPITETFEIKNFTDLNQVNIPEIEKMFRSKGMHIYGIQTDESYINDKTKGKVYFSLRENCEKGEFDANLKEIKDNLREKQGIEIDKYEPPRKGKNPKYQASLTWDNTQMGKFDEDSNSQVKLKLKKKLNFEKITAGGFVDHKYKRK